MSCEKCFEASVLQFSLLPLGEGPGMRGLPEKSIFLLCSVGGEWHSKTKNMNRGQRASNPSPQPSPSGRGRFTSVFARH